MNRIDEIEEKLSQGSYYKFVYRLIDLIKRKYGIFQYDIAKEFGIKPIEISHLKTNYRERKNDDLFLKIIDKYPVDIDKLISLVNSSIVAEKAAEKKRIENSEFGLGVYIYDEIIDQITYYNLSVNTYQRTSKIKDKETDDITSGRFHNRTINFGNSFLSSNTIILNGKSVEKLIKSKNIISGFSTEMYNSDDIYGVKPLLVTPLDLSKDFEDLIKFYFRKKELQIGFKSCSPTSFKKMILDNKKHNKELNIKIPSELVTSYNQFLEYFSDYVKHAKGEKIEFNIVKLRDGLDISLLVPDDSDIETIGNYLNEYLNFTKQNIENLKVNVETDISETDFNLLVLDLKHQVTSLKHSLELASLRNNLLSGQVDHLKELSSDFAKKENVIHTQIINGGDQQFADKIKNKG
ncbi:hypothetical protein [Algibacter lectus]|uniref:Uncharacterized protein n=1 Tax=Algibacter lectus TaxID=221126 RepID=A0A4R8M6T7_9FLAO|nr:hypothetical protein [Algibacter lectus]MWW25818.1 hypothetical protein [Algibacter lectus]TDY61100.1 hypothetical protein DFQ06_3116 [Algibacter lectus]